MEKFLLADTPVILMRRPQSMAVLAVWQLEQAAAEQAVTVGNEITELIDRVMEWKGRLFLPLVGAPYFKKMPHREVLLDAGNVKQFVMDEEIKGFSALETYAQAQERSFEETERKLLSRSEKLRRLKELSAYIAVRKKHHDLKGVKAIERGQINLVVTKDLSKLGRNYLQIGQLIEDFSPGTASVIPL